MSLKAIAMGYFRFSVDHRNYFDVINFFLNTPETVFETDRKKQIDAHGGINLDFLSQTVQEGMDQGVFKQVDPERFAIMFWASLHGMINLKKLQTTILANQDYQALYEHTADHLIDSIRIA